MLHRRTIAPASLLSVSPCAVQDSHIAQAAQRRLLGFSEVDLESCLGVPDTRAHLGNTDILSYDATSTSSTNYTMPIIGGIGFCNGGYCHATFKVVVDRVTQILYPGEKNATLAPDAYCAPILRTCMQHLRAK